MGKNLTAILRKVALIKNSEELRGEGLNAQNDIFQLFSIDMVVKP